jgi:hypothetical protein
MNNSDYNLNSDISQILDPKSDKIQYHPDLPSPNEGDNGEIRLGIRFKNQILMAAKIESEWYFTPMSTLSGLSREDKPQVIGSSNKGRNSYKKGNILTQIDTGTTHASAGSWQGGTVFSHITTDNFIGITCSINDGAASDHWHDVGVSEYTPSYVKSEIGDIYWDGVDKKLYIRVNSTAFQSKPFRAIIFYRNKNF